MKKEAKYYYLAVFGFILLGLGLYLSKTIIKPEEIMRALPYVCIGLGCGILGHGVGEIISYKALKNSPDIRKQINIEKLDERNVLITSRAKAKAYDMMVFIFGALMLTFALMEVDMIAILLLVFAYLFIIAYGLYYRYKLNEKL
jgi:Family of unknown function (DUF6442)